MSNNKQKPESVKFGFLFSTLNFCYAGIDLKSSAFQHLFDIGAEHIAVALLHGSGRFAACEKLIAAAFSVMMQLTAVQSSRMLSFIAASSVHAMQ